MKANKVLKELFIACITMAPITYYLLIWHTLPTTIPIHFDAHGNADNHGSRLYIAVTLFILTVGIYFLLKYMPKIDPKKTFNLFEHTFHKLRLLLALFFSTIGFIIIDSVKSGHASTSLILIIISFLISILGNYMGTIRPNYFMGIRTPWTLENEEVWKKTHLLTGKLWFIVGIAMAILILLLPANVRLYVFIGGITVISIYPVLYSFVSYKKIAS